MRRAVRVIADEGWLPERQVGTVTLPYTDRHRRRIVLSDDAGADFLLDLPEAVPIADGDGLELENGGVIHVIAAPEDVADVTCRSPTHLARVAWHLGNRHLAVQILADGRLRIVWDHVIAAMLEGLGATVERRHAAFQPETGAYAGGGHGHAHGDDRHHGHEH